jgi:hypothetical protein
MPQNNMTRLRFTGSHKVLLCVTSFFNHRDSGLESLADRQKIAATVPSCPRSVAGPGADAQRPAPPRGPELVARESPSHLGSDSLGGRAPSVGQPIGNACNLKMNSSGKVADAGIDARKGRLGDAGGLSVVSASGSPATSFRPTCAAHPRSPKCSDLVPTGAVYR